MINCATLSAAAAELMIDVVNIELKLSEREISTDQRCQMQSNSADFEMRQSNNFL